MTRAPALIGAAIVLAAQPSAGGEADAALTVTAVVLDRCAVAAQVDAAAGMETGFGPAVRLSLHCPRQTGCVAGFGPMGEPQPVDAVGLERCRLDLRLRPAPVVTRAPNLFQVDF